MWIQLFVQWWSKYLQHWRSSGSVWRESIEFSWLRSLRFWDIYSLCHTLILHYKHTKPLINENKGCLFWLTGCIYLDLSCREKPWWINTLSVHTNAYPPMKIFVIYNYFEEYPGQMLPYNKSQWGRRLQNDKKAT